MHGKTSPVYHNGEGLLKGLPNPFDACRYHSLVISRDGFPEVSDLPGRLVGACVALLRCCRTAVQSGKAVLRPCGQWKQESCS